MNPCQLEICIDSPASALAAEQGGASRVELCANLLAGGTTPSAGAIEVVRSVIRIGLQVMIRPRGGDFCYSDLEYRVMKRDIQVAKRLGADGVVFGLLTEDGQIDKDRTGELVELARPLGVTFHRAFDMTVDPTRALEDIITLGIERLLTSGQEQTAWEGLDLITRLVQQADGRVGIMPGGGIDAGNIRQIVATSGVTECHSSGRSTLPSRMIYRNPNVYMGVSCESEYEYRLVDPQRVKAMLAACQG